MNKIFAIVLRLDDVRAARHDLEARLGQSLDRYEPYRKDPGRVYAQLDVDSGDECDWRQVNAWLEKYGPTVEALLSESAFSAATLDVAYDFPANAAAISRTIPAQSAFLAGRCGIDIMISIYPTSDA